MRTGDFASHQVVHHQTEKGGADRGLHVNIRHKLLLSGDPILQLLMRYAQRNEWEHFAWNVATCSRLTTCLKIHPHGPRSHQDETPTHFLSLELWAMASQICDLAVAVGEGREVRLAGAAARR